MNPIEFQLKDEFIPLIQLLKFTGVAESGAMASDMVISGLIACNGKTEVRKRYKVRKGDLIQSDSFQIQIV